jgi:nucleotide-binding universal stress UspA family protein
VNEAPARQVVVLLDDAALAQAVIEMSAAIAQRLRRPLELVYVESAPALLAAALPITQVLAPGGAQWMPFEPGDVERGYRAQAARLRALAERILLRRTVSWSMRVTRGVLAQVALELPAGTDLVLVGAGVALAEPRSRPARRRPVVVVVADDSPAGQQARRVGQELALALPCELRLVPARGRGDGPAAGIGRCDLLVIPAALVEPRDLAQPAQPTLIVGG